MSSCATALVMRAPILPATYLKLPGTALDFSPSLALRFIFIELVPSLQVPRPQASDGLAGSHRTPHVVGFLTKAPLASRLT